MINDNTIDEQSARYWCMFMDKDIAKLLAEAATHSEKEGKNLKKVIVKAKKKAVAESKRIDEVNWNFVQAAHQAAFPMATGNPFQPNFRALDPNSGVPSLQDQQKNNVIAAGTAAALVGAAAAPGAWTAIMSAIAGLGSVGAWFASVAGAAASLGLNACLAIVGGLVTVSSWLYPRIAKLVRDIGRDGVLARCEFEADGEKHIALFSMSAKRWELIYPGRRLASKTKVSPEDMKMFFESQFFKKFLARCETFVSRVYNNNKTMQALETLAGMADKKCKKDIQLLVDAKSVVQNYMLAGKYLT